MKLSSIFALLVACIFFVSGARAQVQSSGNQNLSAPSGAVPRRDKVPHGDSRKMGLLAKNKPKGRRVRLSLILWLTLATGLLVHAFAPNLKVRDNKFVLPSSLLSGKEEIHPDEIVTSERRMQALSAILTLGSAIGLSFYYRQMLFPDFQLNHQRRRRT